MAEVRKKTIEDKYDTSKIKTKNKENLKTIKKENNKKRMDIEEKKGFFVKIGIFFNGVKSEFKKVHWTSKENMVKYSVASIFFILFCSGFFYLIEVLFALIQSLFN